MLTLSNSDVRVVLTTVDKEEKAEEIAQKLVESKLAACVSITRVSSKYFWEGKIVRDEEYLLVIKTLPEKINELREWIQQNHPYTVPEFIVLSGNADKPYFDWMTSYLK